MIITANPRGVQEEGRAVAHMPLGPYNGGSPEAWEDQRVDRLDSPVEGYLRRIVQNRVYGRGVRCGVLQECRGTRPLNC